jgi:membrane-associated phospholipid phosphatase
LVLSRPRSRAVCVLAVCLLAVAMLRTGPAAAQKRLVWNEDWPRFRTWEYVATGVAVAGGLGMEHFTAQPREPRWVGPILFDDAVRRALVAPSRGSREAAGIASDVTWLASQWYTQVVDAALVTYLLDDGNVDVAWQMSMLNAQAMAVGFVLTRATHRLVGRTRPLRQACEDDPDYDGLCPFPGNNAGFVSGHTSMSAVGAGLTCAHHQYLPLYGGGAGDVAACVGVSAVAMTTGVLRVVADRHYVTDMLVGYALGFGVGYGLPVLLHYRHGTPAEQFGAQSAALGQRRGLAAPLGVGWSGSF